MDHASRTFQVMLKCLKKKKKNFFIAKKNSNFFIYSRESRNRSFRFFFFFELFVAKLIHNRLIQCFFFWKIKLNLLDFLQFFLSFFSFPHFFLSLSLSLSNSNKAIAFILLTFSAYACLHFPFLLKLRKKQPESLEYKVSQPMTVG